MSALTWPYPRWVAHRGAGTAAPENTLVAFERGYESGFRMFECDAKLSADGIVYLLHDATLDRTTQATGYAHVLNWHDLSQLDAGSWHSQTYAGAAIPTLEQVATFCIERECYLNIEIKPSPGFEAITGERVAALASDYWSGQRIQPLLTSFKREAIQHAMLTAPHLPRGLIMHTLAEDWQEAVHDLQCSTLACHYPFIDKALITAMKQQGLHCIAYTVNDAATADNLFALGVDAIVTDELSLIREAA